jgi:hypothetical protein
VKNNSHQIISLFINKCIIDIFMFLYDGKTLTCFDGVGAVLIRDLDLQPRLKLLARDLLLHGVVSFAGLHKLGVLPAGGCPTPWPWEGCWS